MALKSYQDFERVISPLLKRLSPEKRKSSLEKMYVLAEEKVNREEIKQIAIEAAGSSRAERDRLQQKRTHIKNAIAELTAADRISPMRINMLMPDLGAPSMDSWLTPVKIPWLFDFQAAIDQLQMMERELKEIEETLGAGVHPKLRRGPEKTYPAPGDRQAVMFPALNVSAINDWFIVELEKVLVAAGCREVNKAISATFEAAFGGSYNIDRVRTRRKRLKERAKAARALGQKP
jgi:hypothetical protein